MTTGTIIFECDWNIEIHREAKKSDIKYWVQRRKEKQWSDVTTAYWIEWNVEVIETQKFIDEYEREYERNLLESQNRMDIERLKKLWYTIT
mgnify:FL=1